MRLKPLFIAIAGLVFALSAQAQWKWKDAKGAVQYSDRPPPAGTPEKDILVRPATAAARNITITQAGVPASAPASAPQPAASAPTRAQQDAASRQKQDQDRENAKQKEEERRVTEQRRDNCSRAQAQLRDLQSGIRITRTNEAGERVFMDDVQRQAEAERARGLVASECK